MIYFLSFIWASLFSMWAGRAYENQKFFFFLFSALSLTPLIILAGYRDITVGTDTGAYPLTTYEFVNKSNSCLELIGLLGYIEPLYLLIGYVSLIFLPNEVNSILLVSSAITIILFYIGFVRMKQYSPLGLSMFFFSFLLYNMSLNLQRQLMAMAVVFLGFTYIINKRKENVIVFLICSFIAFFIHHSAVASFLLIPLFYFENRKIKKWTAICILMFSLFYFSIFNYLSGFSFFSKYEMYQQGVGFEGQISISETILRILFLILILRSINKYQDLQLFNSCKFTFICELILNLLQIRSRFMGRLGYYLFDLYMIFIPYYVFILGNKRNRTLLITFVMLFVVFDWWYVYIYSEAGQTFPYTSKILNNLLL